MYYYGYETFKEDTKQLIEAVREFRPDAVVAVARGGMMLGQLMGYGLGVRNVQSIHVETYDDEVRREGAEIFGRCDLEEAERVLVVDDIVDSGMTLQALLETLQREHPGTLFKTAALFYKPAASLQPDYRVREAEEWIHFFWEADFAPEAR